MNLKNLHGAFNLLDTNSKFWTMARGHRHMWCHSQGWLIINVPQPPVVETSDNKPSFAALFIFSLQPPIHEPPRTQHYTTLCFWVYNEDHHRAPSFHSVNRVSDKCVSALVWWFGEVTSKLLTVVCLLINKKQIVMESGENNTENDSGFSSTGFKVRWILVCWLMI